MATSRRNGNTKQTEGREGYQVMKRPSIHMVNTQYAHQSYSAIRLEHGLPAIHSNLRKMKNGGAYEPDYVFLELIKHMGLALKQRLCHLDNDCISTCKVLEEWIASQITYSYIKEIKIALGYLKGIENQLYSEKTIETNNRTT